MRRWKSVAILAICGALLPVGLWSGSTPTRLLDASQACRIEPSAFYIQAAATLPEGQARAVLRLAAQAVREWPMGEARDAPMPGEEGMRRVVLAASCPADPEQAKSIERRMRMLLGRRAEISTCLTGRASSSDLSALAAEALACMEDASQAALESPRLVSHTGARAQVALRADEQGAMAFLGCPRIPMDY